MDVRGKRRSPGCGHAEVHTIGKLPHIAIARRLQVVARVAIVETAVEFHLQPRVAKTSGQTLIHGEIPCVVLLCRSTAVEVDIAHIVLIAQHGRRVDVPVACCVEGRIEHQSTVNIPLAIDVLRLGSRFLSFGFVLSA